MIKCKHTCFPKGKNICCTECPERNTCGDVCSDYPTECVDAIFEEDGKVTEMVPFESKAMAIMQNIVDLDRLKKTVETQEAEVRQKLEEVMDEYGIKNFENELLKITYVAPTVRETIDSKKLKAELPEIAEKYTKTSQVKGSVRIQVKNYECEC